jgi:hypothetical protein
MRRLPIYLLALALAAAPALTQTPVRLPDLDAATTPLGDDDLFLVRQDGETRDEKVTWANVRASLQDALVLVLGPASVCVDNQLARWDGASNTQLQCSALTVADTTGDITAPGALTISTAGSNGDITLDPHGTGIVISSATIKCGKTSNCNLYLDGFGGGYGVFSGPNWFTNYLGAATSSSGSIAWTSGAINYARDLVIARDAANTLAQRNSTNAQTYRLYGTYTDASNYERLSLSTTAGTGATIAVETDGTGADNLDLTIKPAGTGQLYVGAGGTTAAAPASVVVNATGGSGTDIAGASLTLAGGKGTGDAAGGSVVIQTSDPGASGTTLQTLATRVTVGVERTTIANILSLTGIAAAPGSPAAGDIVYDSVNKLFCGYNGSAWVSFSGAGRGTCWAE